MGWPRCHDGIVNQLKQLAELAVVVGANVQPGQVVRITSEVGQQEMVRAVAEAAYLHGARFVDLDLTDPFVERMRVLHASAEALEYGPRWPDTRLRELDEEHGASIKITGPTAPGLFADLDPVRVSKAQRPLSRVWREVEYRVNNTVVPGPTIPWAQWLRPELPADEAFEALWADVAIACRLHDPDPVAAWRERFAKLRRRAEALTKLGLDALRLHGPGTDLLVGLPPSARWDHPGAINHRGVWHAWNLPSEEVYTVPDRNRVNGDVRLTRPVNVGGRLIDDVSMRFESGHVVSVSGGEGVEALRGFVQRDDGTERLGEVALVDRESAVAKAAQTFGVILLDENAASHVALGFGFPELTAEEDRQLVNDSGDHLDVMVGSDELEIIGLRADGEEHALLRGGEWMLST